MLVLSGACAAHQYIMHGIRHFERNEFAAAVKLFDLALQLAPDDLYARWNRATALLSLGDYAQGFKEHDVAWRLFNWRGFSAIGDTGPLRALPIWNGERGARVLAYHELGYGDAIMALRFLPEAARRAELTLIVDWPLARLARTFDVEVAYRLPSDLSRFDCRLPFFGIMSALEQTEATIPNAPYLGSCKFASGGNKLGLAWSGRTQTAFTLQRFRQLADLDGFTLYALQPGPTVDDDIIPLRPGSDFADVADLIAEMDHVVCVDTAAIHLAGAMGHPSAHLVLPYLSDWRWHRTNLWYPALQSYRQPSPDDWATPFAQLNEALRWAPTQPAAPSGNVITIPSPSSQKS